MATDIEVERAAGLAPHGAHAVKAHAGNFVEADVHGGLVQEHKALFERIQVAVPGFVGAGQRLHLAVAAERARHRDLATNNQPRTRKHKWAA